MAHQSKFVSVNLNKSYGQPPNSHSFNARSRPFSHSSAAASGGGGGGMVVLSRPRSSSSSTTQKISSTSKLSVPPPLNLPSLRKESERFDPASAASSSARPGSSGVGSGLGSSAMGWTKPGIAQDSVVAAGRSGGAYMPPTARSAGQPVPVSAPVPTVEKAVFLRGEDFPSLKASCGLGSKQEFLNQKQKMGLAEEERMEKSKFHSPLRMRPQMRSSRLNASNAPEGDDGVSNSGSSRQFGSLEQSQRQQKHPQQDKYFPGPLPLVRLTHTSDWADDERDTGLSLPERDRDRGGFSRTEFTSRVQDRNADVGIGPSKEFFRGDSFGRGELMGSSKDGREVGGSWRMPTPHVRDDRVRGKPFGGGNREMNRDSAFGQGPFVENGRDGLSNGTQDTRYGRKDLGFGTSIQNGKNTGETFGGRGSEQQNLRGGRWADNSNNRYRGDAFQNNPIPKTLFSSGSRGLSLNDPILNFGREKRLSSNSGNTYFGDSGFDSGDPFSGDPIGDVNVKVLKRKKEPLKQTDFHDPVRESFEAELERVQRIQEQERQRVMEEQARTLELARREQEERERLVREEEERRRLLEEEAREAAWIAEQERLEAARRAEEQKIAREEEKRRLLMEEERRKEAARKKLLELEARIARRQVGANQKDDKITSDVRDERAPGTMREKDAPKAAADVGDWEDGERMVEHITSTSDSSATNRFFDASTSRIHSSKDGNSFVERGKHGNYWRRDPYDNGSSSMFHMQDQDSDYRSSKRDAFNSGRGFARKENYGGFGLAYMRPSSKGSTSEHSPGPDDFRHVRGNRWNAGGDGDHFSRYSDVDTDNFLDNDKFGDGGWGPARPHGSPNPYGERLFQNSEMDGGFSSFGRSRHSLRQPRVLPPPSVSSIRQISVRPANDRSGPPSFYDNQTRYQHSGRSDNEIMQSGFDGGYHERGRQPVATELVESNAIPSEQKEDKDSPRCSQSSLSVSNPPSSPTHLSHDDLDDVEDSPKPQTSAVEEQSVLSDDEHMASVLEAGNTNTNATSSSVSHGEDDEWAMEHNEEMQEQEEYDEEEEGYQEEEEAVHEVEGSTTPDLCQEFGNPPSDLLDTTGEMDQKVLGFDEGIEVSIPIDDDLEKTSKNGEEAAGVHENTVGDSSLQSENVFSEGNMSDSSKIITQTEKALQELVLDPVPTTTNYVAGSVEATYIQGIPTQQQPITASMNSSPVSCTKSTQPVLSSVSTIDSQGEAPVRLQFGLFSGPSLIPSPVPAIQIGSIQMPLHLHPQVGTSVTQMHPSQPPYFQFGQLRYPSPMSQGILPLAPQTMSFIHPPASAQYSSSQNLAGSLRSQPSQNSSFQKSSGGKVASVLIGEQPGLVAKSLGLPQEAANCNQSHPPTNGVLSQGQAASSSFLEDKTSHISVSQTEWHGIQDPSMKKNHRSMTHNKELQSHPGHVPSLLGEKAHDGLRAPIISGSRGKRFTYNTARNAGTRSSFPLTETSRTDSGGFQRRPRRSIRRTEFRVRENVDRRQREVQESFGNVGQDGKQNFSGRMSAVSTRYGVRKDAASSKSTKSMTESENMNLGASNSHVVSSDGRMDKVSGKETPSKKRVSSLETSRPGEGNAKGDVSLEEDVDAPLQSGVVRVFKQPGIEAPSDEDDFIEVRSKRQMLNDRREQREKEIKAKSKVIKAPRKHRAASQNIAVSSNKVVVPLGGDPTNSVRSDPVITDGRGFASVEVAPVFTANMVSQTLPPIGTPALKVDSDTRSTNLKSSQTSSVPATTSSKTKFVPGLSFDNKNTVLVDASLPMASWSNPDINQQVMALTQSQLDDAMKPAHFDSQITSGIPIEPTKPATSIMAQEKPFPSSASPLNSLLAGERIQFGAVTSPTILPPVNRATSNGIGLPGPSRSDATKDHTLTATKNEHTMFFDKEKHPDESCTHLEDAEAEAAASAVAVAAICNSDDIVGNRLGACSITDTKSFSAADNTELTNSGGAAARKKITGQSAGEESLSVALPADLSVDTPLPLWHPLPSPQSTSSPLLSHFPGGPPSHFPFVDMNPILGGPIFAFGPHDESSGTQAQPQRSTALGSGPLGAWPQCPSGVDSFYGPPAGFTGPFISPPGGIHGVQGPPHMVVYNHFAPVGQFGQVGLSFMGATYIPTGKQPDWKHNPAPSSTGGVIEGDISNPNLVSGQRNPPSMPSSIQHLAPGSPLMPMASPLAMFDMSPFQSPGDIPYQARWSHVPPPPPIHSVPLSLPLQQQQQVESGMPLQFSRSLPGDPSAANDHFNEPRSSTPGEGNRSFAVPSDSAAQFPDELGLGEPSTTTSASLQSIRPSYSPSGANNSKGSNNSKSTSRSAVGNDSEAGRHSVGSSFKPQASQQSSSSSAQQQYLHPIGYGDQRGAMASQKAGSGGDWHRRMGYQGRNPTSGPDNKSFGSTAKVKQIYVAKPSTSGPATTG